MTVIVSGHMVLDKALLRFGRAVLRDFMIEYPVFRALTEMRVGITDHAPVSHISIAKGLSYRDTCHP